MAKSSTREEGPMCRRMDERIMRSGGLVGLRKSIPYTNKPYVINLMRTVNVGVLGIVGYFAYANWKRPSWDGRVVSATSAGLIALWGSEM